MVMFLLKQIKKGGKMSKTALVFSGQGSQYPFMGKEIYETNEVFKKTFDFLNSNIEIDLYHLCFNENDILNQTKYTQVAIMAQQIAYNEVIKTETNLNVDGVCGLSLGEYGALNFLGILGNVEVMKI